MITKQPASEYARIRQLESCLLAARATLLAVHPVVSGSKAAMVAVQVEAINSLIAKAEGR